MNWKKVIVRGWMVIDTRLFISFDDGVWIYEFKKPIIARADGDYVVTFGTLQIKRFISNTRYD